MYERGRWNKRRRVHLGVNFNLPLSNNKIMANSLVQALKKDKAEDSQEGYEEVYPYFENYKKNIIPFLEKSNDLQNKSHNALIEHGHTNRWAEVRETERQYNLFVMKMLVDTYMMLYLPKLERYIMLRASTNELRSESFIIYLKKFWGM